MLTIPNILTLARLVLLIPILALFYSPAPWAVWTALFLYVLGAASDGLDGWIARKYNQISAFGIFMDPLSDKIYVALCLVGMIATDRIDGLWTILVFLILCREFLVSGLREYLGARSVKLPVTKLAKWKTAMQMVATGLLIPAPLHSGVHGTALVVLLIATGLTVITGWQYLKTGLDHMRSVD